MNNLKETSSSFKHDREQPTVEIQIPIGELPIRSNLNYLIQSSDHIGLQDCSGISYPISSLGIKT